MDRKFAEKLIISIVVFVLVVVATVGIIGNYVKTVKGDKGVNKNPNSIILE